MNHHMITKFDNDFIKINNLKYLPWIGKEVIAERQKIMIVGESVYNWENDLKRRITAQIALERSDFARIVAYEHGIKYASKERKFARNIEKVMSVNTQKEKDRINFWESIIFHELVQRPLEHKKSRPTNKDYKLGACVLASIITVIKPDKCIFLGTTWSKFASLRESLKKFYVIDEHHYEKINNAWPKTISIKETSTKIYFVKHPSRSFTPNLWKSFIDYN
mgnify:CR=1 FL=1